MVRFSRTKSSVFNSSYHITWTPKYRKAILLNYEKSLKKYLIIKATQLKCVIENMEIMPDHIHIFIRCYTNNLCISKLVQYLKGYSSFMLRKKFPSLKKYKALWVPSYYYETIGNISQKVVKKYINNQKINLKPNYKYRKLVSDMNCSKQNNNNLKKAYKEMLNNNINER